MRAYWRDDLEEIGELPACSHKLDFEEWRSTTFDVISSNDFETGEGFNMLIQHPTTKQLLLVCSIDFDFAHYKPKRTKEVICG